MMHRFYSPSWTPAVGLFGPRVEFVGGRLEAWRMLRTAHLTEGMYSGLAGESPEDTTRALPSLSSSSPANSSDDIIGVPV